MADVFDQFESNYQSSAGTVAADPFDAFEANYAAAQAPAVAEAPVSLIDRVMGGLKGVAKAGTDVIAAPADLLFRGGNAAIDAITGEETNLKGWYPSDFRNQALDFISGGQGDKTTEDVTQLVGNIGTVIAAPSQAKNLAAKIPLLSKFAQSGGTGSGLASLLAKTVGYGTEGAAYGALFNAKSDTLGDDVATSAGLNIAIPAGLKMTGNLIRGLSGKLSGAADETLERGLGIQYGDRTKGLNRVNLYVDEAGEVVPLDKLDDAVGIQAPIQEQVKTLEKAGILADAPNDVQALKLHITKAQKEVGKTIPALAKDADAVIGSKEILPEFDATYKFLQGYRDTTRAGLVKEFDNIIDDYIATPGTGLKKLNKFTDQLQKETSFESAIPAAQTKLKRMIQYDLRKAAEREFDAALPNRAGEFAKANAIYSAAENIGKTLNKPLARQKPSLGDYITGGSLPMTVMTGASSAVVGLPAGAAISGARLLTKAGQQYAEAAFPISTSNLYKGLSNKAAIVGKLTDSAISGSKGLAGLSHELVDSENPQGQQSTSPGNLTQKKDPRSPIQSMQNYFANPRSPSSDTAKPQFLNQAAQKAEMSQSSLKSREGQLIDSLLKNTSLSNPTQVNDFAFMNTLFKGENMESKPLVEAVIWQESRGKSNAVSPKGAQGLMQVMPATAKEIAAELGIEKYDLKDPETNRKFGEYYLDKMLKMFDGDEALALAAYNAGPGAVQKWIDKWGADWTVISDQLQKRGWYDETVKYVPSILKKKSEIVSV